MQTKSSLHRFMAFTLVILLCAATVGAVQARPQAISIQVLINAASPGDTIIIPTDTYTETLRINTNNLTLKGDPKAKPIIYPSEKGAVIRVSVGLNVTLWGLMIAGGQNPGGTGGGVYLADGSLTLKECYIGSNSARWGGGVFQGGPSGVLVVENSQVEGNSASEHGGGLYAQGSASLSGVTLYNNSAAFHGGGLEVVNGSTQIIGGTVDSNQANGDNGGGVNVNNGLTINGTHFKDNTSANSGGAVTQWNGNQEVSISNATFSGNTAKSKGGAVFVQSSFLTLTNSTFTNNTVDSSSSVNTYGGGVYAGGGVDGNRLTFTGNKAKCTGNSCLWNMGGGIDVNRPDPGGSSIANSSFSGNDAWDGGAIGGETNVSLTVTNSSFNNNTGGYGAGIYAANLNGDRLYFQNNAAVNAGGGIRAETLTLTRSRLVGNSAGNVGGGGIFVFDNFTGTNLLFVGNTSTSSSGANLRIKYGPALLQHATITNPTQSTSAAIYVEATGSLTLQNSIVTNFYAWIHVYGTATEDYNLFYNNTLPYILAPGSVYNPGAHSYAIYDPRFINPAGDYHLRPDSPAIGTGANLGVTTDLDGLPRKNPPDKGAYQFYYRVFLPATRK